MRQCTAFCFIDAARHSLLFSLVSHAVFAHHPVSATRLNSIDALLCRPSLLLPLAPALSSADTKFTVSLFVENEC